MLNPSACYCVSLEWHQCASLCSLGERNSFGSFVTRPLQGRGIASSGHPSSFERSQALTGLQTSTKPCPVCLKTAQADKQATQASNANNRQPTCAESDLLCRVDGGCWKGGSVSIVGVGTAAGGNDQAGRRPMMIQQHGFHRTCSRSAC